MQKLQLSIPEPCHENWQKMTPTNQGRFCNACAKEVVDFSTMTDMQVLNYFSTGTHEKVCGRALPDQLNRTISRPVTPKKRLFWYWNYIVMFFMFFGKGNQLNAQGKARTIAGNAQIITDAQLNLIRTSNVNNALAGKVAGVAMNHNKVINGKVIDKNGNPVSFALIKIKGATTDVYADANGVYSIKVNSNAILVISGAGFKEAEVVVERHSFINTVMEKGGIDIKEVVITGCRAVRQYYEATFVVKGIETGLPISKAKVVIVKSGNSNSDIAFTNSEGKFQAKRINARESYDVKIVAEGYKSNEFSIEQTDFKNRKEEWEVLLRKRESAFGRRNGVAAQNFKGDFQVNVMGQTRIALVSTDSLYMIDGVNSSKAIADKLNPDDISDIVRLNKSDAAELFGINGSNGAIVITTTRAKEIKLKEVVVTSEYGIKGAMSMAGGISFTNTYENSFLGDTIATVKTFLTDSIKVYPNPVNRNTGFSVALKLKQAGNYSIQVTDATGKILLLQKFNATAKDHTEKIMSDSRWAAGIYYIRVFDAQNKLINKSSFIFN